MNSLSSISQTERRLDPLPLALLLGAALFRFINLGFLDLQAWDEALYAVRAQAALYPGMIIDQTLLAVDGLYSSLHPPLYIWGTAIFYQLMGVSEISARLFSAISGGLTVFAVYSLGKHVHSKEAGLFSSLVYSLNPFTVFYSRQGQFDTLLVLLLTLSVLAVVKSSQRPDRRYVAIAGILVGCALMAKLFVGLGIPFVYALWIAVARPENKREHWIRVALVLMLAAAVAGPWHVFMVIRYGDGDPFFFLQSSAFIQRTFFGIEGNVKPLEFLYYINQLAVLFPFGLAAFLYGAWVSYRERNPLLVFLVVWFLFFFLIFSLMRTKLAVYLLPMLVPASVLAGISLQTMASGSLDFRTSRLIVVSTVFFVIWSSSQFWRDSVKSVIAASFAFHWPDKSVLMGAAVLLAVSFLGCGFFWLLLRRDRQTPTRFIPSLVVLALFCLSSSAIVFFDRHQYVDGATSLAEFIDHSKVSQIVVAGYERNPQLTYYLRGADIGWRDDLHVRRIVPPNDTSSYRLWIQQEMIGEPGGTLLIVEKDKFIRYRTIDPQAFLSEGYARVFESRRYAAFLVGQVDFLASTMPTTRN